MQAVLLAALTAVALPADTTYLYRALTLRAAPGRLAETIELYRRAMTVFIAAGDRQPFMMRHRQGDQWDLMLIFPMESHQAYYSPNRIQRRAVASANPNATELDSLLAGTVAWREETFVSGPPLEAVSTALAGGNLYHIEMFIARPGKRAALLEERHMENAYLAALDRPQNLIFTRVAGGAWDLFTLGVYRDMTHFAASDHIPADSKERAAQAAGFEGSETIGFYLRTLIHTHHDTLAGAVR